MLKTWSYTRLSVFEECPFRAELAYVQKVPEPQRPLPRGKSEHANDRGSRIHEVCEHYVIGKSDVTTPEMDHFLKDFNELRDAKQEGRVFCEEEWGFDKDWTPTETWNDSNTWARIKLDAVLINPDERSAVVIDYKTGKKFGNEFKHGQQCQLYAIAAFIRFPNISVVRTELWYLDQKVKTIVFYRREDIGRLMANFTKRAIALTECTEFFPKPSLHACKWCPYGAKGTGHCSDGV